VLGTGFTGDESLLKNQHASTGPKGAPRAHSSSTLADGPISSLLWPSCAPPDSVQRDSARRSPSLASLPKPSASLQERHNHGKDTASPPAPTGAPCNHSSKRTLNCFDIDWCFADRSRGGLLTNLHAGSSTRRPLHQSQTPASPLLAKAARADPALVNFAISMRAGTVDRQTESVTPAVDAAKPFSSPAVPQHLHGSNFETGQRATIQLYYAQDSETGHFAGCKQRSPDRNRALSRGWPLCCISGVEVVIVKVVCGQADWTHSAVQRRSAASSTLGGTRDLPLPNARQHWQQARPSASTEAAQPNASSQWTPMRPAQKRASQPLGSGEPQLPCLEAVNWKNSLFLIL